MAESKLVEDRYKSNVLSRSSKTKQKQKQHQKPKQKQDTQKANKHKTPSSDVTVTG